MSLLQAIGIVSGTVIAVAVLALVVSMCRRFRGPSLLNVEPGPYWFVSESTRHHARALAEREIR